MQDTFPIQALRRDRRRTRRHHLVGPIESANLVFSTANGEDQVSILPASAGSPRVWFQVQSIFGESMQTAEVLLNRRNLRSVLRLLARAAYQLEVQPFPTADTVEDAYHDEVSCRAAEERYEAERDGIEFPEDF